MWSDPYLRLVWALARAYFSSDLPPQCLIRSPAIFHIFRGSSQLCTWIAVIQSVRLENIYFRVFFMLTIPACRSLVKKESSRRFIYAENEFFILVELCACFDSATINSIFYFVSESAQEVVSVTSCTSSPFPVNSDDSSMAGVAARVAGNSYSPSVVVNVFTSQ